MQFQNLKISSKILSSILVIAIIVLSGSLYVRSQISHIDSNYQALINGEEIAVLETSITLRLLVQYSTAIYTLTLEESEEGIQKTHAEVKDLANRLLAREALVRQYIPDRAEKLREAFSGIPQAIAVCTPVAQEATTSTAAADILRFAMRMKSQCEPVIHAAMSKARDYALALNEEMKEESHQLSAESASVTLVTLWLNVAGLVLGSAIALAICRFGVTKPLARLGAVMSELAGGRLDVVVPSQDRKDEVGDMARTVLVFQNNAREVEAMRAERERQKEQAELAQRQAMIQLADSFEAQVMGVVRLVAESAAEMEETARNVAIGAQESSRQSVTVAAAAQQSTSNVETVATAAEELSASIAEISRQVADAAAMSSTAAEETTAANRMVAALDASAARIGEVVKLINDIASQTNLLALNATIEAARAGEAGKGFAVVANEVKSLANQTAKATEEIAGQIGAVQSETQRTVDAIKSIGNTVEMVRQTSAAIASAVEEQGAATREIARNVEQAAQGTHDVSANVVLITRNADGAVSESGNILRAAQELAANAEKLRTEVSGFLSDVRAG